MKIKKISFTGHPILGDKKFDFTNEKGEPFDTILITGENGTGKTTLLEVIKNLGWFLHFDTYSSPENKEKYENFIISVEYKVGKVTFFDKSGRKRKNGGYYDFTSKSKPRFYKRPELIKIINSSVGVNYYSDPYSRPKAVKDKGLDNEIKDGIKDTPKDLSNEIVDLLISIDSQDSQDYRNWAKSSQSFDESKLHTRMHRFTEAFEIVFGEDLKLDKIVNNITPIFTKQSGFEEIEIYNLSSGEKQIIFRGAFLLEDKNSLKGSLVLIDEPEISMHPKWQEKIFDYYKSLFIDENKQQNSQIFMTTHSDHVLKSALVSKNTCVIITNSTKEPKIIHSNSEHSPDDFVLETLTTGEIMYQVFGLYTIDFHQALFERMKEKFEIKGYENSDYEKLGYNDKQKIPLEWPKGKKKNKKEKVFEEDFLCLYIRNYVDHPLDGRTVDCLENEYLKTSIDYMIEKIKMKK